MYSGLLSKTHYEAIDFRKFDYWKIEKKSKYLTEPDRFKASRRLKFLENEWPELRPLPCGEEKYGPSS